MVDALIRKGKFPVKTNTHGEDHVETKAEIGVMQLQAKEHLGSPKTWKKQGRTLLWRIRREYGPSNTLISNF